MCAEDPIYTGLPACRLAPPSAPSCSSKGSVCGQGYPGSTCCSGLVCEGGYYGTCASPPPMSPRALTKKPQGSSISGVNNAGLLSKWPEGCELCSLAAATASLVQFYTHQQTTSNSLQCNIAATCEHNVGPCCFPTACSADSGLGACLDKADCLKTKSVSSIQWAGSMFALKVLTGKKASTAGSVGPLSVCENEHVVSYPDASGKSFWYQGGKLTQPQVRASEHMLHTWTCTCTCAQLVPNLSAHARCACSLTRSWARAIR